jgi:hypothetical protein
MAASLLGLVYPYAGSQFTETAVTLTGLYTATNVKFDMYQN